MNKTKLVLGILVGLLLIGGAIGAGMVILNKDVEIDKRAKDALVTKGISDWDYVDTLIGEDYIERCLISPSDYRLPCQRFKTYWMECMDINQTGMEGCENLVRRDFSEKELEDQLNSWEKERMEQIGNVIKNREERTTKENSKEETRRGKTTPTEKK